VVESWCVVASRAAQEGHQFVSLAVALQHHAWAFARAGVSGGAMSEGTNVEEVGSGVLSGRRHQAARNIPAS